MACELITEVKGISECLRKQAPLNIVLLGQVSSPSHRWRHQVALSWFRFETKIRETFRCKQRTWKILQVQEQVPNFLSDTMASSVRRPEHQAPPEVVSFPSAFQRGSIFQKHLSFSQFQFYNADEAKKYTTKWVLRMQYPHLWTSQQFSQVACLV